MAIRVQNRRGTEARWLEVDPILLAGEIAFVKDKNYIKIGDGVKTFSTLEKISGGSDSGSEDAVKDFPISKFKGVVADADIVESEYNDTGILVTDVCYITSAKQFVLKVGNSYYESWSGDNPSTNYNISTNNGWIKSIKCRGDKLFLNAEDSKLYYFVDDTLTLVSETSSGDIGELPTNLLYFSETQPEEDCDIIGEIIDNTDSTRKDAAASANMARHLNEKIEIVDNNVETLKEDTYILGADGSKIPKAFIDLWELSHIQWGNHTVFNYDTKYFECQHVTDINYKEALGIYTNANPITVFGREGYCSSDRVNIMEYRGYIGESAYSEFTMRYAFYNNSKIEKAYIRSIVTSMTKSFNCANLKWIGPGNLYYGIFLTKNAFIAPKLEQFYFLSIGHSTRVEALYFSQFPNLLRECIVEQMLKKRSESHTSILTIYLHQDAYDRLTPEDLALAESRKITLIAE